MPPLCSARRLAQLTVLGMAAAAAIPTFADAQEVNTTLPTNYTAAYVQALSDCAYNNVIQQCTTLGLACDASFDPSGASDPLAQCNIGLAAATAGLPPAPDPCQDDLPPVYDTGLHVAGIFIILGASLLGSGLPLAAKYSSTLAIDPFLLCLGKCMGIGIILACALVHLLQPASEELTNPCLPYEFTGDYSAYAFLYCMLAILFMQFLDFLVEAVLIDRMRESHLKEEMDRANARASGKSAAVGDAKVQQVGAKPATPEAIELIGSAAPPTPVLEQADGSSPEVTVKITSQASEEVSFQQEAHAHGHDLHGYGHGHGHDDQGGHSHVHSVLLIKGLQRTLSAYLLEFGVTSHSILIGLTTGIVGQAELRTLLVALCFHQCFEGVALGSRIAEANLGSKLEEFGMVSLFSFSAPLGMIIGVALTTSINPSGETYNMAAGTLDGICAGILLYIGLLLLVEDFPADMLKYCTPPRAVRAVPNSDRTNGNALADQTDGPAASAAAAAAGGAKSPDSTAALANGKTLQADGTVSAFKASIVRDRKHGQLRKFFMFVALWTGAGVMAYIGKYL